MVMLLCTGLLPTEGKLRLLYDCFVVLDFLSYFIDLIAKILNFSLNNTLWAAELLLLLLPSLFSFSLGIETQGE